MPTIEIGSIGTTAIGVEQVEYSFAAIEDARLKSHRGLFNEFLSGYSGTMVHLGNPEFTADQTKEYFFASSLVDFLEDPRADYQFCAKYMNEVFNILSKALDASPTHEGFLLSDIQSEHAIKRFLRFNSVDELRDRHDNEGLIWNTCYLVDFRPLHTDLWHTVDAILYSDWDPIGIFGDAPEDEYQGYVPRVVQVLKEPNPSSKNLANILDDISDRIIGVGKNRRESERIARLLISMKEKHELQHQL